MATFVEKTSQFIDTSVTYLLLDWPLILDPVLFISGQKNCVVLVSEASS